MYLKVYLQASYPAQNKPKIYFKVRPEPERTKLEKLSPIYNSASAFLITLVGKANRNLIKFLRFITVTQQKLFIKVNYICLFRSLQFFSPNLIQ